MLIDKDTVQKLLQRSRDIDQMKAEINTVVSMVVGLSRTLSHPKVLYENFESDECVWVVWFEKKGSLGSAGEEISSVVCNIGNIPGGGAPGYKFGHDLDNPWYKPKTVEIVHRNLPVFLKGMVELFPDLEEKILSFLDVS